MSSFDLYNFFLCLFVFIALTTLFTFLILYIAKLRAYRVDKGGEDARIRADVTKKLNKSKSKCGKVCHIVQIVLSTTVCVVLCLVFLVTCISGLREKAQVKGIGTFKVIASTSMSTKYEGNKYLFENDIDNQLQLFDLVAIKPLPPVEELDLYDVVVYEHITGVMLIHRIVGIEEPNESHPDEYHFLLQGDAVHYPDTFPVRYSQMRGIYEDVRIPNVGSFVYFMQSPAGIICFILVLATMILSPIADNWLARHDYKRVVCLVDEGLLPKEALMLYGKSDSVFKAKIKSKFKALLRKITTLRGGKKR